MKHAVLVQAIDPPPVFIDLVRSAEASGADPLFVADSSLHGRAVWPYLTLAATATRRLRLGSGITHPISRHPAVTANAVATLDEISGGRAVLGIGSGDRPLLELGLRPSPVGVLEEAIHAIRALLEGQTVTGQSLLEASLLHAPGSRVPILVAASGPRTLRMAGRVADGVLMQVGIDPRCVEVAMGDVIDGAREAGRDPADLWLSVMAYGSVRDDAEAARAESRHFAAWIPQTTPRYCDIVGIPASDVERVREVYAGGELMKADRAAEVVTEEMVDAFTLAGNADQVRGRLADLASIGINHVTFFPMGPDRIGGVQRFASVVD